MDTTEFFHQRHELLVDSWFRSLSNDRSSRYHREPDQDLRARLNRAAKAFRQVMLHDDWVYLQEFITQIAQKRFNQGFTVSEVQKAFELYRQTLIPLLFADLEMEKLEPILMKLQECMVFAITQFSEYFQDIHENFLRNHNNILEREIEARTRELAESRQKYKTLVEDINDGFFVLAEGRIVFANRSFARMYGYEHEQVLQKSYLNFIAEEHREVVRGAYESGLKNGNVPTRYELLRLCRDGSKLPTEIMVKRTLFGDQPADIGICRDISERVELEKRKRETEKLKALAQQAACLAHEVRNPLSTVRMNLQMFCRSEKDPKSLRLFEASLAEVDRIERSLKDMIDISFPLRLTRQPVDLRQLLAHCLESMRQRLADNQVRASLRQNGQVAAIKADPHRLEQALINLLFNAVEAQPTGGRIAISIRPQNEGAEAGVEILISDQGPGVPKEMLPYLFDPMFSQKISGNGLGLHNVKRIIEAHGGSVRAKLNRPRGMGFHLRLPVG